MPQKTFLPPFARRATVDSVDETRRTARLVFSTGAPVLRVDLDSGARYREVLSLAPGHVRLERLNSGAPLLDVHTASSVTHVIGVVEDGSARVTAGQGVAVVRFSRRPQVEPIFQDVRDRIITAVSVGYQVHRFVESAADGKDAVPTRTATDWEPFEVSLVPMPADGGAKVLRGGALTPCIITAGIPSDADRGRRLALAQRASVPAPAAYDWPRQQRDDAPVAPTISAEKWAAVRRALEKFLGLGPYAWRMREAELPAFDVKWDDAAMSDAAVGTTHYLRDGRIVLSLRSDCSAEQIHGTALHELQHVADHALAAAGWPTALLEQRARATRERLECL